MNNIVFFRQSSNREEGHMEVRISQQNERNASWEKLWLVFDNIETGRLHIAQSRESLTESSTLTINMERVISFRTETSNGMHMIILTTSEQKLSLRSNNRDEVCI